MTAANALRPGPEPGRRRLPLAWLVVIPFFAYALLFLKGYAHPARFADLVTRKAIPKSVTGSLPSGWLNSSAKFASLGQQAAAKAIVNAEWSAKVG